MGLAVLKTLVCLTGIVLMLSWAIDIVWWIVLGVTYLHDHPATHLGPGHEKEWDQLAEYLVQKRETNVLWCELARPNRLVRRSFKGAYAHLCQVCTHLFYHLEACLYLLRNPEVCKRYLRRKRYRRCERL